MQQKGNFLLLEPSEFMDWLDRQTITRRITMLQVHHTWSPNYTTRKNQDGFRCLEGMRTAHLGNGWSATGQHISVLETGQYGISLDRDLNKTPAGIKGANTGAVTIEIIGNFDEGGDRMTEAQRAATAHLYACLALKLKLPVDTDHIVYHAWFTPDGSRLADYTPGKSSKTCPGTRFWGDGNTVAAAKKGFLPAVQAELERLKAPGAKPPAVPADQSKEEKNVETVKNVLTKDNSVYEGLLKDNQNYVPIDVLRQLGHKVTWDNVSKKLYIS
ncbi:N-acetylmuramoyl-L-alanine amidase [Paenibacillus sp. CN-4]|uniref:peptidoglycan recognition protein family protein n=1 Tax=Paenibacillus nanchangensis TaxID=3348343 RepID=UPI00397DC6FC